MRLVGLLALVTGCAQIFGIEKLPAPPDAPPPLAPSGLIGAGANATCAIHDDGTAWCWGSNSSFQLGPAATAAVVTTPTQVSAATWTRLDTGINYTCGVQTDQSMACWGVLPAPMGMADLELAPRVVDPGPVAQAFAGLFVTCKIDMGGELACRGANGFGELGDGTQNDRGTFAAIAEPGPWRTATIGFGHVCAIKVDGTLWCWGSNVDIDLAHPNSPVLTPTQIGSQRWTDVAAGGDFTCGITDAGQLRCWGGNSYGSLGIGSTTPSPLPVAVLLNGEDADGWVRVRASSAAHHACGLRSDGSVYCWGRSSHGESGADGVTMVDSPQQVPGTWKDIAVGSSHTCALDTAGGRWCFGTDGYGELGDGGTSSPTPVQVAGTWSQVATHAEHTCALATNGVVSCVGINDNGALGDSTQTSRQGLVPVTGTWMGISVGDETSCGWKSNQTAHCWGRNDNGQLGVGNLMNQTAPAVVTGSGVTLMSTTAHGCMVAAGNVSCWGPNDRGQVGNGTTTSPQLTPVSVVVGASSVGTGELHTCILNTAHLVQCWGGGSIYSVFGAPPTNTGALGQGSDNGDKLMPTTVTGPVTGSEIAVGPYDTCAIDNTNPSNLGQVKCWGLNQGGELLGLTNMQPIPMTIAGNWSHISLGLMHGCGIKTNSTLWCWGSNSRGQRGGPNASATALNQVMPGTPWSSVAAGAYHTCAIDQSNNLYCWGANDDGALATGTAWHATPVQAP
jgi:alpha-tubulin suppressor-like RCC1 family protein